MAKSSANSDLGDGLTALRRELQLTEIMRLIERTARWLDPDTFRLLPLWYPEHARRAYFYKSNWSEPQMNKNRQTGHSEHKREGNLYANKSLTHTLGLRSDDRPNWSCCHIWGIDDALYQETNAVVQDRRFYSCIANMVLLPMPLKAFTDAMPEVKAMLRICARNFYGWHCDHQSMAGAVETIDKWRDWSAYPESWPRLGSHAVRGREVGREYQTNSGKTPPPNSHGPPGGRPSLSTRGGSFRSGLLENRFVIVALVLALIIFSREFWSPRLCSSIECTVTVIYNRSGNSR